MPTKEEALASEWTTKFAWFPHTIFGLRRRYDRTIWLNNYIVKK